MKRLALILLASLTCSASVWALGSDYRNGQPVQSSSWPEGLAKLVNAPHRVHGFWVNSEDIFFFAGNTEDFNRFLQEYSELKSIAEHKLIRHGGTGVAKSPWDKGQGIECDWKVYAAPRWVRVMSEHPNTKLTRSIIESNKVYVVEIELWTGGNVDFKKVSVPSNVTVVDCEVMPTLHMRLSAPRP